MPWWLCQGCLDKGFEKPMRFPGQVPPNISKCSRCKTENPKWKKEEELGKKLLKQAAPKGRTCLQCKIQVGDPFVPSKHLCVPDPSLAIWADYKYGISSLMKAFASKDDKLAISRCERVCKMCAKLHCLSEEIMDAIIEGGINAEKRKQFYKDNLETLKRRFTPGGDCVSPEYVDDHIAAPEQGVRYYMAGWEMLLNALKLFGGGGKKRNEFMQNVFDHDKGYPHVCNSLMIYDMDFYTNFMITGKSKMVRMYR